MCIWLAPKASERMEDMRRLSISSQSTTRAKRILNEKDFQYFLQYENECIAVAQNASNEPIFADVINGQVVHLEKYECTTAAAVVRVLGGKFLEVHRHVNVSESQNPTLGSDTWC